MMVYKALLLQKPYASVHEKLPKLDGDGGLIAVDREGHIVLDFNCLECTEVRSHMTKRSRPRSSVRPILMLLFFPFSSVR